MFERLGLRTTLIRDGVSILTKEDQGVDFSSIWDKKLVERKLDVMKNAYEQWKDDMEGYIGTVVLETMHRMSQTLHLLKNNRSFWNCIKEKQNN